MSRIVKLNLKLVAAMKNSTGEIQHFKGDGFSWTKPENASGPIQVSKMRSRIVFGSNQGQQSIDKLRSRIVFGSVPGAVSLSKTRVHIVIVE